MTNLQKLIKYLAMGLASLLALCIIGSILGAAGLLGGLISSDATADKMKPYAVSGSITSLYIDIHAADLTIKQGEAFFVESNLKELKAKVQDGVLSIKETNKLLKHYNGAALVITIPKDTVFEKVEITTGAGRLTADTLSANILDCDFGAGEIKIGSLLARSKADIDGGAGKITISGGVLNNLDFDMGVGQLNFTSQLTGKSELDLGIGQSNITLLGGKDSYCLDIEKGIGSITVDGSSISNISELGSGENGVDISGGVGSIRVDFFE